MQKGIMKYKAEIMGDIKKKKEKEKKDRTWFPANTIIWLIIM